MDRARLEALVDDGWSIRRIAAELGVSYTTVRHWLKKFELTTPRARRLAETDEARRSGVATAIATCTTHGETTFVRTAQGTYRCPACRSDAVATRRRTIKQQLVEGCGGRCALCGYDRSPVALQFHHREPADKAFSVSQRGVTRTLQAAMEEAQKCVLLCANCHAEVEAGVATLGPLSADYGG
jgi:hypothetical protein